MNESCVADADVDQHTTGLIYVHALLEEEQLFPKVQNVDSRTPQLN